MTEVLFDPISGRRVTTSRPSPKLNTPSTMHAAIEADAAVRDASEMAERFRAIGAIGASAALEALVRERKARADRVWTMTTQAMHAGALASSPHSIGAR